MTGRNGGFSLIETTIALSLVAAATAATLAVVLPSQDMFAAQPEVADMQQRLRVAADTLFKDLLAAQTVFPYRLGALRPDPAGSFKTDTITLARAPVAGSPTTITYWQKSDEVVATYQLMAYDGTTNPDIPVIDHLVGLSFEYVGDPQPPRMRRPLDDPHGPWTTYGPVPSAVATPSFAAGENCVFTDDGSLAPQPRLPVLGDGTALIGLARAQLSDGPWCPDDGAVDRFDADVLRIRRVAVTLRVQAAIVALRGPAGVLFAHGGTSPGGHAWVPDQELRFDVAPRNLNLGR